MSIYQTMNKGGMSLARFDEPQTLIDMGLPAMNELMQSENAWDAGHEMVYDELSELDQSRLGAPGTSTVVSLYSTSSLYLAHFFNKIMWSQLTSFMSSRENTHNWLFYHIPGHTFCITR